MTTDTPNPFARYVTDDVVEAAVRAATGAFYVGLYSYSVDNAMRSALLAALAIIGPKIRRDALEEAANIFEQFADKAQIGARWNGNAPLNGPAMAVVANRAHAAAIRALGEEG